MGKKRKDSDSARKRREDRLEKSKERAGKYFDSGVIRAGFLLMQDANESVLISASVASQSHCGKAKEQVSEFRLEADMDTLLASRDEPPGTKLRASHAWENFLNANPVFPFCSHF